MIVETTGGTACGVRHRVPATGGVRGFEVAIDDAHADIAWSDDAGVSVLELAHDGSDATYVLPGMTSLTRWVALGDGRRVSMPGTDGRPAIWRSGSRVGVLMIDADAGDVTQLDGLVAVAVEAGPLAFFDVPTFPSERPPRAVLELDPAGFRRPALAWLDGDLVVAWEVTRDGRELVRGARVDGGNQLGTTARVLIGPYDLMDGRRPKLGTTSTRVVIGTPYPGDCGDVVILSWRDTAFETIVDRDLLVDLDEAGDGFRFASGAAEVTIAATQVLLTRSETGQVEPACASPMFARITDSGETGVVLPGASP